MPISAIGNRRCVADAGFSLVEAMTALFVVGLIAGAAFLMAPNEDAKVRRFAEAFASRLSMASEESIIGNRPVALLLSRDGYGFARLDERGWTALTQSALSFRTWPDHIEHRFEAGESDARADVGAEDARPAIRFDSSGGATPGAVALRSGGAAWIVRVDGQGQVHVVPET